MLTPHPGTHWFLNWVAHCSLIIPEHTGAWTGLLTAHCLSRSTLVLEPGCSMRTVHPGVHWFLNWVAYYSLFIPEQNGSRTDLFTANCSSWSTSVLKLGCLLLTVISEHVGFGIELLNAHSISWSILVLEPRYTTHRISWSVLVLEPQYTTHRISCSILALNHGMLLTVYPVAYRF